MFRRGVAALTIRAITGHTTEQSFLKYVKVDAKEHAQLLRATWLNAQTEPAKAKIVNF